MRAAVIDIGSSSTKLVIGQKKDDDIQILENLRNVIDIGQQAFYQGRITQDIINELIGVLDQYKNVIRGYDVDHIKVIATTAVREANNKDVFIDTITRKTGFEIEVLNVGDVVFYIDSFLSQKLKKTYPIHKKNLLIAELGAGSLDISIMEKGYTLVNFGIPTGTLRLQQFKTNIDASQEEIHEAIAEYVENQLLSVKKVYTGIKIDDIILVDENYSSLIQNFLVRKEKDGDFFPLQFREAKQFLGRVTKGNVDDLTFKYRIPPALAESLDIYAIILSKLYCLVRHRHVYVFRTSLSQSLLANMLLGAEFRKKYNKTQQLISVAKYLCRKFDADIAHNDYVAYLCDRLFKDLKNILGLNYSDHLYLTLAAYLHNIGTFVNNRSQHKHTEYIINSLSLFRLTDSEIAIIACVARYHRRSSPRKTHYLFNSLTTDEKILVQKLSALLRIANALDSSHRQKVNDVEVHISDKKGVSVIVYTQDNFVLEKSSFHDKKDLFEEVSGSKVNLIVKRSK